MIQDGLDESDRKSISLSKAKRRQQNAWTGMLEISTWQQVDFGRLPTPLSGLLEPSRE